MDKIEENIAIYNNALNFIIKFTAPAIKDIYSSFIIEEVLHRSLAFNYRNTYIKYKDQLIAGIFQYDDKEKLLRIEIENPAENQDTEIEITIATNIIDLGAIVESNYIISNMAYIKIKGYEDVDGLITKSNLINIKYNSVKIDINAKCITKIVPAINGERIIAKASFNTLNTNANYDILVKNNMGENIIFDEYQSYASIDGKKLEYLEFIQDGTYVSVNFHNSEEIKNKKIDLIICGRINNTQFVNDVIFNEFILFVNNVECSRDSIEIQLIKPISILTNSLLYKD